MLCLPPRTTHEAQPLDCDVLGPLKSHWSNVCHAYLQQNPGKIIKFSSQAWGVAVSPANITAGFRTCGVYPSAISVTVPPSTSSNVMPHEGESGSAEETEEFQDGGDQSSSSNTFTAEQEKRFRIRYEEGFNVFTDKEYNVQWLGIHHPEPLPCTTPDRLSIADCFSLVPAALRQPE